MKYNRIVIFIVFAAMMACSIVPITGRKQLSLVPESEILSMSFQQYDDFIKSHKLSNNAAQTQMVKRVGQKIEGAVEKYFAQQNQSNQLSNYKWEFNLVEDSAVNAWCMPGGKVVIYTGIMPVVKNEEGLAVVMGHEIAHAVAKHGDERMSQALLAQMGSTALSAALKEKPEQTKTIFLSAYGVGAQVGVLLPYSRLQESEADHIGLILMAMSGYDPHAAIDFWQRMMNESKSATPAFLSDHPSDEARITKINELIPEAMQYYKKP
jgi:predicted Zn-dependent protease